MIEFGAGLVLGTAFAPLWMMLYNNYAKPQIEKLMGR